VPKGSARAPTLGIGAWLTPKTPFPYVYYHTKFGRSISKHVGISRRESKKFGSAGVLPLGMGAW